METVFYLSRFLCINNISYIYTTKLDLKRLIQGKEWFEQFKKEDKK